MKTLTSLLILAAAPMAFWLPTSSAHAGIQCSGPYQVVQGRTHATPYCRDLYLAEVARRKGMRVTDAEARSVSGKNRICRLIGRQLSVRSICAYYFSGR